MVGVDYKSHDAPLFSLALALKRFGLLVLSVFSSLEALDDALLLISAFPLDSLLS